jgi:hypothetical protein
MSKQEMWNPLVQTARLDVDASKAELLTHAKAEIDAAENSLRRAADALALAGEGYKATQREIVEAVGRPVSGVNRLLKWRRSGYRRLLLFKDEGRDQARGDRVRDRKGKE